MMASCWSRKAVGLFDGDDLRRPNAGETNLFFAVYRKKFLDAFIRAMVVSARSRRVAP